MLLKSEQQKSVPHIEHETRNFLINDRHQVRE